MRGRTSLWVQGMAGLASCIGLSSLAPAASDAPPAADELQKWIAQRAVPIRSIDASDEDFRDLEPLIDAIGAARVVQLGEPSHQAGSTFAAKVRLIKFLHQRMGFDVVAWESGLYDVHRTQVALRAGQDAVMAAQTGILATWSWTEDVRPLFEYAKATQATRRPLEMAGFDSSLTGAYLNDRFAGDLRSFVRELRDQPQRDRASGLVEQALAAHQRLWSRSEAGRRVEADGLRAALLSDRPLRDTMAEARAAFEKSDVSKLVPKKEDVDALEQATAALLELTRTQRAAFLQVHGARQLTFMERVIENLRVNDRNVYDRHSNLIVEEWNRRDAQNVRNLRWLIEDGYPGRKIIVWAHNVHVMNAYYSADVSRIHVEPPAIGLVPSGVELARWLGDDVYTIAMTHYDGEEGWGVAKPIIPAKAGSLESRLHQLGQPYVFLDFRALDGNTGHPMRKPLSIRIDKNREDLLTDVTRAFDAVFYVDRMVPVRRIHYSLPP
jgi:erythromycin esterase